jgi:hypothetical protein
MGQIVIDIPTNAKRRYVLTDKKQTAELLVSLEESAVRVKRSTEKQTKQQIEDDRDYEAARKNYEEMRRTGVSYTVDELRKEFGLR